MFGHTLRPTARLRTCPVCRSEAMRDVRAAGLDDGTVRLRIRCGECDTWRLDVLESHRAERLLRRLARSLERDYAQIADALRRLEADAPVATVLTDAGRRAGTRPGETN